MRIAVLCNDRLAIPAIDQLLSARLLVAAGMPDAVHETRSIVQNRCDHYKVPFRVFTKKELREQLMHWLDEYEPDVVLVKTFPFRIPGEAIARPKHGFVNFHYAPLPEWRGSNPLFWMIRNQVTEGGITVHRMNAEYDAGPVLLQQQVPCHPEANFGLYCTQLAFAASNLTGILLNGLHGNSLQEKEQDHTQAKWYGRPQLSDLFIDWKTMTAAEIKALVKACNPWNKGAGTRWNNWPFGITYASVAEQTGGTSVQPGTVLSIDAENGLRIATADNKVIIADIIYCEEGFYPGYCMNNFGLKKLDTLT